MTELPVRVMVQDVWDEIAVAFPPTTSLAEVKRRVLSLATVSRLPGEYVLKFRGAELADESQSLADAGIPPNAPLIILPRHRQPVR